MLGAGDRSEIQRVAVIGAGTMGAQIAARSAYAGKTVALYDAFEDALDRCRERIDREILPAIDRSGQLPGDPAHAKSRLRVATSLEDAVLDVDLVIEAVREEIGVKRQVFGELSSLTGAILATNSSSLPSSLLVEAVDRPERVLNMHFFAPIWVRTMLEVMSSGRNER
jgi:3-hydroxyacyl-CoA dehydrogenase